MHGVAIYDIYKMLQLAIKVSGCMHIAKDQIVMLGFLKKVNTALAKCCMNGSGK